MNDTSKSVETGGKLMTCIEEMLEEEGIVIVTGFADSSHYMAHTREAAMIDWVGVDNLTNERRGSYYGGAKGWCANMKENYGLCILFAIFKNYLNDGSNGLQFDSVDCKKRKEKKEEMEVLEDTLCEHDHTCCINCNKVF